MWEKIRLQLMHRMVEYARICENKWTGNICPKVMDKLQKNVEYAKNCFPHKPGHGVYEVMSKQFSYEVNMLQNSCDCRRWQLTGIPCSHAAACMREERIKPETRIASCYTRDNYMKAYGHTIWPVRDKSFWEKTNAREVGAPLYKKKAGRKANKRREHPSEKEEGTRLSKYGVKMHCSHCRDPNHKRPVCPILHPELKLQPQRRNNEEDIDDPSILDHIVPEEGIPELIPTQCSATLVVDMLVEEINESENFHSRRKGPLPSNAFVEEHINSIPVPRATTATRGGLAVARGRGRGKGRATSFAAATSTVDDGVPTTTGRARVGGTRRRPSTRRVTGGTSVVDDAIGPSGAASNMSDDAPRANTRRPRSGATGDGAARERGRNIKHGRLYHMLFGSH